MIRAWVLILLGAVLIGDAVVAILLGVATGDYLIVVARLVVGLPLGLLLLIKGLRRRDRVKSLPGTDEAAEGPRAEEYRCLWKQ